MRTFDCRVVFIDEVTLDQLDCEAALSHSTASYHHQLVFPEELGHLLVLTAANGCCGVGSTYFRSHCVDAGARCDTGRCAVADVRLKSIGEVKRSAESAMRQGMRFCWRVVLQARWRCEDWVLRSLVRSS